jgi:hypothetical protein
MVMFVILDYPIFLSWSLLARLVGDAPVMTVSCVVAFVGKTLSRS